MFVAYGAIWVNYMDSSDSTKTTLFSRAGKPIS